MEWKLELNLELEYTTRRGLDHVMNITLPAFTSHKWGPRRCCGVCALLKTFLLGF